MNTRLLALAVVLAVSSIPAALFCGFVDAIVYLLIRSGGNLGISLSADRIVFRSHGGGYSGAFTPQAWFFLVCSMLFVVLVVSLFLLIGKRRTLRKQREQRIESYTV